MCQNANYKFAELKSCCPDAITKLEKEMENKSGKEIVLIAYEKR